MSVLASETQNKVSSCRGALLAVERHLEPLFSKSLSEVSRKLAPLENAELQVGLAYTVASLYFCNLLTQGTDPSEHPIRQELDRIQLYFKKLKTTAEEVRDKEAESSRVRVDAEAAKRIVQHYTGAVDAAAQRQAEASSSSASSLLPHSSETAETSSPRKKRKIQAESEAVPEVTETVAPAVAVVEERSAENVSIDAPSSATEPTVEASPPASAEAPPVEKEVIAPVAKPPVAKAPVAKTPPVAKAPVAKVQPASTAAATAKAPSAKVEGKAHLRPLAAPVAPAITAKIPQGTAADTIVARAKADAQRAALKKKRKKVPKKGAEVAVPAKASAEVVTSQEESAMAAEDPYAVAMDDPYA